MNFCTDENTTRGDGRSAKESVVSTKGMSGKTQIHSDGGREETIRERETPKKKKKHRHGRFRLSRHDGTGCDRTR